MHGTTRVMDVQYEPWDGTNLAAIQSLTAGLAEASENPDGTLKVLTPDGEERAPVQRGWVVLVADGLVIVQGRAAHEVLIEPA